MTNGHIDIIERASKLFDELVVGLAADNYKSNLFTLEERIVMMKKSIAHLDNVEVESFSGLSVEFAKRKKAQALIRGLRVVTDFEYEMQLATMNKHLNENLDTLFLMTTAQYAFLSSSIIKQVALTGGSVEDFVPEVVEQMLKGKYDLAGGVKA